MPSFERTTADTFLIITARNISFLPQKLGFTVAHLFITIGHYSPNSTCQVLSQLAADTAPLAIFSGHLIGHIWLLIGSSSLTAEMKSQSNYKPVCVAGTSDPQLFREFHSICSSLETPENLHFKYNRSLPRLRSSRNERVEKRVRSRLWYIFGLMHHAVRLSFLYSCLCVCRPVRSYNLPHISFCMCVQYYQGKVFGDWHKVIDTLTMVPTIVAFDWLFSPVQSLTFLFLSFFLSLARVIASIRDFSRRGLCCKLWPWLHKAITQCNPSKDKLLGLTNTQVESRFLSSCWNYTEQS